MTPVLGPIIGTGPSRCIGVLISLVGLMIMAATLIALNVPMLRRVELALPDHDQILGAVTKAQLAG